VAGEAEGFGFVFREEEMSAAEQHMVHCLAKNDSVGNYCFVSVSLQPHTVT